MGGDCMDAIMGDSAQGLVLDEELSKEEQIERFLRDFNPTLPLDAQLSFPFVSNGVIVEKSGGQYGFRDDHHQAELPEFQGRLMSSLLFVGYLSHAECQTINEKYKTEETVTFSLIKKALDWVDIKNRRPERFLDGGYFVGDIKDHRNHESNLCQRDGHRLNVKTGCYLTPDGAAHLLTPFQTQLVHSVLRHRYGSHDEQLAAHFDSGLGKMPTDVVHNIIIHFHNINERLGGRYFRKYDGTYQLSPNPEKVR